jgi:hypothetical protein
MKHLVEFPFQNYWEHLLEHYQTHDSARLPVLQVREFCPTR